MFKNIYVCALEYIEQIRTFSHKFLKAMANLGTIYTKFEGVHER